MRKETVKQIKLTVKQIKLTVKQIKFLDNFVFFIGLLCLIFALFPDKRSEFLLIATVFFIFHIMIRLHIESYEIKEILKGRKKQWQ